MNNIPNGYNIYEKNDKYIILSVTNFLLIFEESPYSIEVDGVKFIRDTIESIPKNLQNKVCSMRKYVISD